MRQYCHKVDDSYECDCKCGVDKCPIVITNKDGKEVEFYDEAVEKYASK